MLTAFLTLCVVCAPVETIVLENALVRITIDPRLFSIRDVGFPGKPGFMDSLSVAQDIREGTGWADAGGLQTDLLPYTGKDAALRRGPAEVLEQRGDYVAMLGPSSEQTGIRLKKEVQLIGREARARFRVTAIRVAGAPQAVALRNTVRVPLRSTIRVPREDVTVKALAGTKSIAPAVVKSRKYWIIPVPPTAELKGVILGAFTGEVVLLNQSGSWTRRLVSMPQGPDITPNESSFLCLLDDESRTYGASLQGESRELKTEEMLVLEEEWIFDRRGD
ncbi:MAG: hypothetical protein IT364_12070 [Candidatus Hydrogenedentes bacterium]|nr:hypothetical protein [Candidatus Hydrogenedentota bacterium]